MTKTLETTMSDSEYREIEEYAELHGMTIDEAASQLVQQALAKQIRTKLNRGPARIYSINRSQKTCQEKA